VKKLAIVMVVALGLGGCSTLGNIGTGISLVTKSVTNPVTKTEEAQVELAIDAALAVLRGYKQACIQGTADKSCRVNIQAIQKYTRQMPPLITQLRGFVDTNDQVNAVVVYNQLTSLYTNFKTAAGQLGYNVGNLP
jgi:hypothetical protein